MKKLLFLATFLLAGRATAQCPYYATCPSDTSLFCDYSTNDPLYWNAAPFTWNPGLMLSDLPEAEVELGIVAKDSCGGQNLSVQYTLFLDLDGNDTVETVVRSDAFPPAGKILYNNILSPNYALGDTIDFDHRVGLPDSMRYRFGLEIVRMADSVVATLKWTTGILSPNYSLPFSPLGKHRIQWRIEQGGVERFCEYGFEVKDCAPPVVTCIPPFTTNIHPFGAKAQIWDTDLLYHVADNITSQNLIITAIRKLSDNGAGFPLDTNGTPNASVTFFCLDSWVHPVKHTVELWAKDKAGNVDSCRVDVSVVDGFSICNFDPTMLLGFAFTTTGVGIHNVKFTATGTHDWPPVPFTFSENSDDDYWANIKGYIACGANFIFSPSRKDNILNGVTTYDLVLMSKHILGLTPFDSPEKMIAADANRSGSLTTFDIVEFRKLILGIYDTLPNNQSWRFWDKSFVFPNPQNPFETDLPDTITIQNWLQCAYDHHDFTGIKIGDVNNTAIPNASAPNPTEERSPNFLLFPDCELKPGETIDIPIRSTENAEWLGLQFSLEYDPELLDIESIESATLPDFGTENWAQPRPGQVSLSWSDATAAAVSPDGTLLQLRIKARTNIQLSRALKTDATPRLQPELYDSDGAAQPLQFVFSTEKALEANQIFAPQPNPTTMGTLIPVQLSQSENLRVEICNLSGKVLWDNDLALEKGSHLLEIPAAVMPHAGLYLWRVRVGEMLRAGKITRM